MKTTVNKTDDGTITITVTIPWDTIAKQFDALMTEAIKQVEIKGFRKGKAPRDIAEKEIDRAKIYEEAIKHIIPELYQQALKKQELKPIMDPDIRLAKAREHEDWEVVFTTCEKPTFDVTQYQEIIKKAKAELKKDDLWLPGKDKPEPGKETEKGEERKQKQLGSILDALLQGIKFTIPEILIREDVNRKLVSLVDQLTKLGMTIDSYCKSKGTTAKALRKQYEQESSSTYKLEFILEELAEKEHVTVEESEVKEVLSRAEDPKEREQLEHNKYYLAGILRRQKTLDRLMNL